MTHETTGHSEPRQPKVARVRAGPLWASIVLCMVPAHSALAQECSAVVTNESTSSWMVAVLAGAIPPDLENDDSELLSVAEIGAGTTSTVNYPSGRDIWIEFKRIHIDGRTAYDIEMPGPTGTCAYLAPGPQVPGIVLNDPSGGDIRFVDP